MILAGQGMNGRLRQPGPIVSCPSSICLAMGLSGAGKSNQEGWVALVAKQSAGLHWSKDSGALDVMTPCLVMGKPGEFRVIRRRRNTVDAIDGACFGVDSICRERVQALSMSRVVLA